MPRTKEGPYLKEWRRFEKAATWLDEADGLMLLHARMISEQLDASLAAGEGIASPLANTLSIVITKLEKKRPVATAEVPDDGDDLPFK